MVFISTNSKDRFLNLSAVSNGIREAIHSRFGEQLLWIVAEISEMSVRKGHCYLSLVEKLPGNSAPMCEMKGIVWAGKFEKISQIFRNETGTELAANTTILFQAMVRFDVKWGLSLIIEDIEPKYTVGLLQVERDKTVARLREEGVYEANKRLQFPLVPSRIAVISARDSRGYEDFLNKLENNPRGYHFNVTLFSSLLQGDHAATGMVNRLIEIFNRKDEFDVVVIVRGGGGAIDLNCFNDYKLSRAVARFPLPVISGIGHTTNKSVVDEVAFADAITPTDAADFIIEKTTAFEERLDDYVMTLGTSYLVAVNAEKTKLTQLSSAMNTRSRELIRNELYYVSGSAAQIQNFSGNLLKQAGHSLSMFARELTYKSKLRIREEHHVINNKQQTLKPAPIKLLKSALMSLENTEQTVKILDPVNVLKRGFSITLIDNRPVLNSNEVKTNDRIKTILYEGTIESEVKGTAN